MNQLIAAFIFLIALTTAFVWLKFAHIIDWSWWLVFLPLLIPCGVSLCLMAVAYVGYITYPRK